MEQECEGGLFRAYALAGGPTAAGSSAFLEEVCCVFVVCVLEAELLVVRARAGYIVLAKVMRLISIVLNSLSTLLFLLCYSFRRRLKSVADVLKGIRSKGLLSLGGMLY